MKTPQQGNRRPPPPPKPSHLSQSQSQSQSTITTPSTQPRSLKRGIPWPWDHHASLLPLFLTPTHSHPPTWLFNWELWVPPGLPPNLEWTPCVRTAVQCPNITPYLTDISTNQHLPTHHFLGFNEPEMASQANLSPEAAAAQWTEYVLPAKERLGFRLGSPGMTSDLAKSRAWLDAFFARMGGVEGARVDFLVLHWYGLKVGDLKVFLEVMHEACQLPVWLNEFACSTMGDGEASEEDVETFLREAVPWLEACEWIERYAYFGNAQGLDVGSWVGRASNFTEVADGHEDTGGRRLTRIGKLYLNV